MPTSLDSVAVAAIARAAADLGVGALRPLQAEAAAASWRGEDVLLRMPTGGGKSLCWQLVAAALRREGAGPTVVVSPLVALMADQQSSSNALGLRSVWLQGRGTSASGQGHDARAVTAAALQAADVVFLSPERAQGVATQRMLRAARPRRLVVDEAHCVSEWGHDFRPEYRKLASFRAAIAPSEGLPTLAMTATATPQVWQDIVGNLGLRAPATLRLPHRRPNLALGIAPCRDEGERRSRLLALVQGALGDDRAGPGSGARVVLYVATRKRASELASWLRAQGVAAGHYHAGRTVGAKDKALAAFDEGRRPVLVATSAWGMGVDRADVRLVVHAHTPASVAAWWQGAGRAGRDGQPAAAWLLTAPGDAVVQRMLWRRGAGPGAAEDWRQIEALVTDTRCRQVAAATILDGAVTVPAEDDDRRPCGRCDACCRPAAVARAAAEAAQRAAARSAARRAVAAAERAQIVDAAGRDAIVAAVAALPRPVGAALLVQALRGSRAAAVRRRKLDQLPGFGALRAWPDSSLRGAIDDLLALGRLARRGRKLPTLWIPSKPVRGRTPSADATADGALAAGAGAASVDAPARRRRSGAPADPAAAAAFRAIDSWCKREARARRVKPFMVLPQATTRALSLARPQTLDDLAAVAGIGPARLARYGADLLALIATCAGDGESR